MNKEDVDDLLELLILQSRLQIVSIGLAYSDSKNSKRQAARQIDEVADDMLQIKKRRDARTEEPS